MVYRIGLSLLLCFVYMGELAAQKVLKLEPTQNSYVVGKYIGIAEDKDGKWQLKDAQTANYVQTEHDVPILGFNPSIFWLKLEIQNTKHTETNWNVAIEWPILSEVQCYVGDTLYRAGEDIPYDIRPIDNRNLVFPLTIPKGQSTVVYFRIKSRAPQAAYTAAL